MDNSVMIIGGRLVVGHGKEYKRNKWCWKKIKKKFKN